MALSGRTLLKRVVHGPARHGWHDADVVPLGARAVLQAVCTIVADAPDRVFLLGEHRSFARVVCREMDAVGESVEAEIAGHLATLARVGLIVLEEDSLSLPDVAFGRRKKAPEVGSAANDDNAGKIGPSPGPMPKGMIVPVYEKLVEVNTAAYRAKKRGETERLQGLLPLLRVIRNNPTDIGAIPENWKSDIFGISENGKSDMAGISSNPISASRGLSKEEGAAVAAKELIKKLSQAATAAPDSVPRAPETDIRDIPSDISDNQNRISGADIQPPHGMDPVTPAPLVQPPHIRLAELAAERFGWPRGGSKATGAITEIQRYLEKGLDAARVERCILERAKSVTKRPVGSPEWFDKPLAEELAKQQAARAAEDAVRQADPQPSEPPAPIVELPAVYSDVAPRDRSAVSRILAHLRSPDSQERRRKLSFSQKHSPAAFARVAREVPDLAALADCGSWPPKQEGAAPEENVDAA